MLKILGDCNFADGFFDVGFGTGSSIKNGADPFQHIKEESNDDFWIGNFECVCSDVSLNKGVFARQFIISSDDCDHIGHLNLYGVANNHVMQHGQEAYEQMIGYFKRRNILYAGTKEIPTTVFIHQERKVSITVLNQRPENFFKPPLYYALPEYKEVEKELSKYSDCDFRIVYVHWGVEYINYPYNDQKQFAHYLIDCGADLVIGMHPHVLQGFEVYKGKYVFYSLGNCVFNMPWEATKYSLQVNIDLELNSVSYQYLHIGSDYFPEYVEQVPHNYSMDYLNSLIDISEDNEKYFSKVNKYLKQYQRVNRRSILKSMWRLNLADMFSMFVGFINRRIK